MGWKLDTASGISNIWQFSVAKVSVLMRSVMKAQDADMAGHAGPGVIAPGHSIY